MKQHEYMVRCDKDVFEDTRPHYLLEVSTNNFECYREIKNAVFQIITRYETQENRENKEEKE